jgi:hypothetical protein
VLSIDAAGRRATLRVRHQTPFHVGLNGQAVDPMYLILHGAAYLKWVELHHPHEPRVAELKEALRALSRDEQDAALSRAKALQAQGKAVEEAIAELRS